ncbi:putative membrane protein [Campylobacter blaseri]|uniref:Uncharacterized protein n=1 Tax=Campylobacter blaseri TaxID=2042961 RepID=A0A2P8R010_9BACT|nr:hypothetical protein [Campylobacter blaseri]PSM51837.1 hypothetical protein CQ405_06850 [Campylobacter blaseri]PSM53628.1 hypothetical protein CRN67_06855 [Campylobacter blaseri]QKF86443.1 putative membrane protein [Campylobacter blaseri]
MMGGILGFLIVLLGYISRKITAFKIGIYILIFILCYFIAFGDNKLIDFLYFVFIFGITQIIFIFVEYIKDKKTSQN